jgi:hypothetical protein
MAAFADGCFAGRDGAGRDDVRPMGLMRPMRMMGKLCDALLMDDYAAN